MPDSTDLHHTSFVTVDLEATGCCPGSNSIIEIGAARIEHGTVVDTFSQLVRPTEAIPPVIVGLTSITDAMVADAPDISEAIWAFRAFAGDAYIIAHNHRFDLGFLDYEAELAWGTPFRRPVLDTVTLAKRLHPEIGKQNLALLSQIYEVSAKPNHRAAEDALASAQIFLHMVEELAAKDVRTINELARYVGADTQSVLIEKLPLTQGLPPCPGVFMLRDAEGTVAYVGSAKNLRLNVRNAFYAPSDSPKRAMAEATQRIDWFAMASEFEAMLVESRLIRRYHPRFNARGRSISGARVMVHVDTGSNFPTFRVTHRPGRKGVTIGPFTSRSAVDRTVEQLRESYGLRRCSRRLNLATAERACEYRDTNTCPSPCSGGVGVDEYRSRVNQALDVFDHADGHFKDDLVSRLADSEQASRPERAMHYREAIRAWDRVSASLRIVRTAHASLGPILVDVGTQRVALHFVRDGYVAKTLRTSREAALSPAFLAQVQRAVLHWYYEPRASRDPLSLPPGRLREIFMVANYRTRERPIEVKVAETPAETTRMVTSALQRILKAPRRTHALA